MKDNNKNNSESNNLSKAKGIAVGMVIGAAAVALKDKKNQEYVKKSIKKVKEWAEKTSAQVGPQYAPITSEYLDYDEVMEKYDLTLDWLAGLYVNTFRSS